MEHVHSEHVAAAPDTVYAALSDRDKLVQFIPQITKITPKEGDEVEVEARYDGHTQTGEAYFRADASARTLEWGTDGGYKGWINVEPDGDGAMLTLGLHTTHVDHADRDIGATLDAMRRLVEAEV